MIIDLTDDRDSSLSDQSLSDVEMGHQNGVSLIMVLDKATDAQLKSLLSTLIQSHIHEWIIIDYGTSPTLKDALHTMAQEAEQVILLKTKPQSITQGWQLGAEQATGEYLFFLDSHFALSSQAMKKAFVSKKYVQKKRPWMMGFDIKLGDTTIPGGAPLEDPRAALSRLWRAKLTQALPTANNLSIEPNVVQSLKPTAYWLSTNDFFDLGGFDEKLSPSYALQDLALRIHCEGGEVYCTSQVHLLPVQQLDFPNIKQQIKSCVRFYQKHYSKMSGWWLRWPLYVSYSATLLWFAAQIKYHDYKQWMRQKSTKNSPSAVKEANVST